VVLVTDEEHRPLSEETPLSPGFEMRYDTLRGEQGIKGDTGARGATGARGETGPVLTRRKAWAVVYLFALAVFLSGTGLFWINHEVRAQFAAQQRQEQAQAAAKAAAQRAQAVGACRQFGGLVQSIVQANAETKHAVTATKSFGELFSEAVQRYYAKTDCAALTRK
jgi:hypothetical protein